MNENKLFLKPIHDKLFTVNKNYHERFKDLKKEELIGLCKHNSLLEKVHQELKSSHKFDIDIEEVFGLILYIQ
jgi:hypothetical protein